jgi:CRP-like cAMP-binding protein
VVRLSEWGKHPPGTELIKENSRGDNFYILASGEAKIVKRGKLLNVVASGECIGEMAYLADQKAAEGSPRSADVITMGAATSIKLTIAALRAASQSCRHEFDRAFLRILVERLALANTRMSQ